MVFTEKQSNKLNNSNNRRSTQMTKSTAIHEMRDYVE